VYSYDAVPDAVALVAELPVHALTAYAELIAFLELTPWEGAPYREDKPEGSMRTMPFGKRAEGMAVYVILEEQRRVVVVSVTWLELSGCAHEPTTFSIHTIQRRPGPRPGGRRRPAPSPSLATYLNQPASGTVLPDFRWSSGLSGGTIP
jgi:hypothetical protein